MTTVRDTSARRFRQHIHRVPPINPNYWALTLTGITDGALAHPSILTWDDLTAYPSVELACPVVCGHISTKPENAPLMFNANWRGVPVSALLADLELRLHAAFANIHAADGYSTFLTLDQLRDAVLVYAMDGSPLPLEHGYPTRLIVPGLAGYKLPKWVERIEFSARHTSGTWESRGWDSTGTLTGTRAAILNGANHAFSSRPIHLYGTAHAVSAADSSTSLIIHIDHQILARVPISPAQSWHEWSLDWTPPHPGDFYLEIFAQYDANDPRQVAQSSVLHAMTLHVR